METPAVPSLRCSGWWHDWTTVLLPEQALAACITLPKETRREPVGTSAAAFWGCLATLRAIRAFEAAEHRALKSFCGDADEVPMHAVCRQGMSMLALGPGCGHLGDVLGIYFDQRPAPETTTGALRRPLRNLNVRLKRWVYCWPQNSTTARPLATPPCWKMRVR